MPNVNGPPPLVAQQVFMARQPIFDGQGTRVAYELLYRATREASHAFEGEAPAAPLSGSTGLHALLSIGLEQLRNGATAYVNVTTAHLLGDLYRMFDPRVVVLELLESVDGTPAVVDACRRAVASGYTLALDDYDGRASLDALLPFVRVVKMDVLGQDLRALGPRVASLRDRGLEVLAERVETPAAHALAREIGCTLFQGYLFSHPETLEGRAVRVDHAAVFRIVTLLTQPDATEPALEDAFRSHPSLALSLLRIVNSASIGGHGVESLSQAIRLVGRQALSRWMLIMLAATVGTRSPAAHEAVVAALVRGRFCETITGPGTPGEPAARFLVGLLSRMDVLLGLSLTALLEELPVSEDVRDALVRGTGPYASVLELVDAYEHADWTTVETFAVGADLCHLYAEAVGWATERLASVAAAQAAPAVSTTS